ncbi:MAG: hypothetical protein ACK4N5_04890 [Myxococcales bacterium]
MNKKILVGVLSAFTFSTLGAVAHAEEAAGGDAKQEKKEKKEKKAGKKAEKAGGEASCGAGACGAGGCGGEKK